MFLEKRVDSCGASAVNEIKAYTHAATALVRSRAARLWRDVARRGAMFADAAVAPRSLS